MKKKFCMILMAFFLLLPALPEALAQDPFVWDQGEILSQEEENTLEQKAGELRDAYGCSVYVVTVPEYRSQFDSLRDFSKNFYKRHQLGFGEGKDGIMLLLSMEEREYWLLGYGDFANTAMTDYGREVMEEKFVDDFREDSWFSGFQDYLNQAEFYLRSAAEGEPFDRNSQDTRHPILAYVLGFGAALLVASVTCMVYKNRMKTAGQQVSATAYVPVDGVNFEKRVDLFTHVTTQRVAIESESKSSGGTTVDSDGFSGSGGSF